MGCKSGGINDSTAKALERSTRASTAHWAQVFQIHAPLVRIGLEQARYVIDVDATSRSSASVAQRRFLNMKLI
jgi:hypothetical protein